MVTILSVFSLIALLLQPDLKESLPEGQEFATLPLDPKVLYGPCCVTGIVVVNLWQYKFIAAPMNRDVSEMFK